jgi:hypothetical protein
MAIAARMAMMATTTITSINVKPLVPRMKKFLPLLVIGVYRLII